MATETQQRIYRTFLNGYAALAGSKRAKVADARFRYHRRLDLDHPRTLADKVSWIELNTDRALAARCTDKWEVRGYVAEKGLADLLVPTCGGPWASADDVDVSELPSAFVLKATHGSGMNFICKDKSKLDARAMLRQARYWLSHDYGRACVEPHYKLIPHRVYAEGYIGGLGDVIDYKFHCLNGEPRYVLTCSERAAAEKLNLYDCDWNPLDGLTDLKKNDKQILRPQLLGEMLDVARALSADFDFVRVDLYEEGGHVWFGELTFSPAAGGVFNNYTDAFIAKWGKELCVHGL